ncbi:hypothetical protein PHISCL_09163 [Aspergillus sclerotialis]|uniref:Uncharacterized protein n=1 Tax=Aspergillus sclerotialis TaxID=2070753 RepID=A0A3A2ZB35_9EURO|nr:hypothetical protein PHISCL_09163 [Aspergillus sclerotialis]
MGRGSFWCGKDARKKRRERRLTSGYISRAHQEDSVRGKNNRLNETQRLQREAVTLYTEYLVEGNYEESSYVLNIGTPAPNITRIKDFIRWYIASANGQRRLSEEKKLTVRTTCAFAERFICGYKKATTSKIPVEDRTKATALLELDGTKSAKLPALSLEAFLNSVITLAKKTREQPSGQEILGKLNSLHPIAEDITLIKNVVNNVLTSPASIAPNTATRIASWAEVVRSGTPSYPLTPDSRASTTASVKDRETVVKLDANAAAVLRKASPEDLRKRFNGALGSRINLLRKAPRVIAAKQLKSGDVVLHTATTAEGDILKNTDDEWVRVLGTIARVIKPMYGVIVHGVRTSKDSIDTDNQQRAIEKIESENAVLHEVSEGNIRRVAS